jgi:hypothetical protein
MPQSVTASTMELNTPIEQAKGKKNLQDEKLNFRNGISLCLVSTLHHNDNMKDQQATPQNTLDFLSSWFTTSQ